MTNTLSQTIALNEQSSAPQQEVLHYWQEAGDQGHWFSKDAVFDADFRHRFAEWHGYAANEKLDHWTHDAEGSLALLILLDQYPRNAFRGTPRMYATDKLALKLAHLMLDQKQDRQLPQHLRLFCYLPLSHSEDLQDQARAVTLNRQLGPTYHQHALGHQSIIQQFGRFPHRNAILGRVSTPDEHHFLDNGGFAG